MPGAARRLRPSRSAPVTGSWIQLATSSLAAHQGDHDGEVGLPVGEIGGAVDRVDDPDRSDRRQAVEAARGRLAAASSPTRCEPRHQAAVQQRRQPPPPPPRRRWSRGRRGRLLAHVAGAASLSEARHDLRGAATSRDQRRRRRSIVSMTASMPDLRLVRPRRWQSARTGRTVDGRQSDRVRYERSPSSSCRSMHLAVVVEPGDRRAVAHGASAIGRRCLPTRPPGAASISPAAASQPSPVSAEIAHRPRIARCLFGEHARAASGDRAGRSCSAPRSCRAPPGRRGRARAARPRRRLLRFGVGMGDVAHMQDQVGLQHLLERGAEGGDQVGRQVGDEADRVGQDDRRARAAA